MLRHSDLEILHIHSKIRALILREMPNFRRFLGLLYTSLPFSITEPRGSVFGAISIFLAVDAWFE